LKHWQQARSDTGLGQRSVSDDIEAVLQVTVAMQEDGRLVRPAGKMAYPDFLKWIKKKLKITMIFEASRLCYNAKWMPLDGSPIEILKFPTQAVADVSEGWLVACGHRS
jgi:hypothetical protein